MSKPCLTVGSVVLSPGFTTNAPRTAVESPRAARFALDNCSEIQRRFIHSLGALFSTNPRTFEDVLAGRVYLTARPDGNVATLRPNPL